MSTPHTPGPWYIDRRDLLRGNEHKKPLMHAVIRSEDDEQWTALVEGESNARLIASAPELLAALEGLVSELSERTHEDGRMMSASFVRGEVCRASTLQSARAAIAKAKGQE